MRGARPERAVEQGIERSTALHRGERVLIACSGGPDSVALLAALHALAKRMELSLCAAHVNHGTRPSSSQDECIALQVAGRCEMPIDVVALALQGCDEARLRSERYGALAEIAKRRACAAIATAHHAEDQSETVLLALLRGAGPAGIGGMAARREIEPGLDLARPLLGIGSEELRAYCHAQALPYAVDPTNAQTGLRRNAVREA
ncbi:MAG: tRNA lysidine(34) synthetase TilS, partial [Candidatus Baltobacteraceae bacterium]